MQSSNANPRRINKGRSLIGLLDNYTVIDIETTGLDPQHNNIIEIAALRVVNGEPGEQFSTLVNPACKVNKFITDLTGITNKMLANAPMIMDVLPGYLDFIGEGIVVGHNVNFDINFIYENTEKHLQQSFTNDFLDTMKLSRKLFSENRHHRLCDLVMRFGICESVEHRALADVFQTQRCYEYMKEYIKTNGIIKY